MTANKLTENLSYHIGRWWGLIAGTEVGNIWTERQRCRNQIIIKTRKGQIFRITVEEVV